VSKIFLIPFQPKELQLSVGQPSNAGSEDAMSKSREENSSRSDSDMETEAIKESKGKSLKKQRSLLNLLVKFWKTRILIQK
jgi:hypothetical protein